MDDACVIDRETQVYLYLSSNSSSETQRKDVHHMWNLNLRTSKLEVLLNWVLKFFLPILLID